jgi:EAL and modified HD-GYP domain-containing signal transduction protein
MSLSARPPEGGAQDVFIGRQPIVDAAGSLFGYELLYRDSRENRARVADATAATATVIANLVHEFGIDAALGSHVGFINVDAAMLCADMIEMLPSGKVVLELLETIDIDDQIVQRCAALKQAGFRLALDDVICIDPGRAALVDLVDFIKIEVPAVSEARLERLARALRPRRVCLLAEKVDTLEQVERCRALGFELFQGYYFARPTIIEGKSLGQSEMMLLKLLGLVLADAEAADIERTLKQAPTLSANLLRLTNSVGAGVPRRIGSLNHAVVVLGRRQLQRWLQLLLFSNPSGREPVSTPLMTLAATRGRLMELIALRGARNPRLAEQGFLAGVLSLLPALFGVPMAELLRQLPLEPEIASALTGRGGRLGTMLALIEELEQPGAEGALTQLAAELDLAEAGLNAWLGEALAWAHALEQER